MNDAHLPPAAADRRSHLEHRPSRSGTRRSTLALALTLGLATAAFAEEPARRQPALLERLERGSPLNLAPAEPLTRYVVEGHTTVEVEAPVRPVVPAPAGAVLTADRVATLERVYFAADRAEASTESLPTLAAVAQVLRTHPAILQVRVEAHTDALAPAPYNQALSERRAVWVRAWLIEQGIDAGRLDAAGFGASRPLASNDTAEGRHANRRVEFVIVR